MKKQILTGFLCTLCFGLMAQQKKPVTPAKKSAATPATPVLKTALDSLSYAIGALDGNFFRTQGIQNCNPDMVASGFHDALKDKMLITPQLADQLVRAELQRITRLKIQPNIDEGKKFLDENRKRPGVIVTPTGLQYEVITLGTGQKPGATDQVKVHYEGFLLNGKKFDSSRDRGEPVALGLNQVIRGWTEGVQLMPVGSRYKFYVPYQLGYGEQGAGETIPGGSTLIFDIELIEIVKQ